MCLFFFFNDTATTEIYTLHIVGSVRCVQETGINAEYMGVLEQQIQQLQQKVTYLINEKALKDKEIEQWKQRCLSKDQDLAVSKGESKQFEEKLIQSQANIANILQAILQSGNSDFMDLIEETVSFKEQ
eukprot:TRINITY_DN13015_c0_g1_i1.p2 TRINITY_DN13015_c0_g1~~TRINITY_DN13015_c0_g1_i1.p2  ORF type:complete len:129 (+),score=43.58 TRINITY_DN13015_c0_g1_i1:107-493(+)